jgi:nitroreductase
MREAHPPAAQSHDGRAHDGQADDGRTEAAAAGPPAHAAALSDAAWQAALDEAALAPSVHNVQPGRVAVSRDGRVWLARAVDRALPVGDPTLDDVLVSVGALAEGLAIALAPHGLGLARLAPVAPDAAATIDAHGERCVVVATTRLVTRAEGAGADPLAGVVEARRCHRGTFKPLRDTAETRARVEALREHPDVVVRADPDVLALAAVLVDRATLGFMADVGYRRELYAWLRLSRRHPRWHEDGLRADCLGLSPLEAAAAAVLLHPVIFGALHRLGLGGPVVSEAAATRSATALVGFSPPADLPPMEVGRRLYRAWLAATAAGLALAPMSALTDEPAARTTLARALAVPEGRRLRLVFRAGPTPEVAPPRSARLAAARLLVPVPAHA